MCTAQMRNMSILHWKAYISNGNVCPIWNMVYGKYSESDDAMHTENIH